MIAEELQEKHEKEAQSDAEYLGLLLLLLMRKKDADGVRMVIFDAAEGRFYFNGRSVSAKQIRKYLLRIEDKLARRIAKLVDDLEAEKITIKEFQEQFERNISSAHILAGALALGGIVAAARNPVIAGRITEEIAFAEEFISDVDQKKAGSFRRIKARAKSYVRAASITFSNVEQTIRDSMGIQTEAKRIRRASESCKGCIAYAGRWLPISEMPPIGTLQCKRFCRCFLIYR